ncbi:MAG: hypothetical protein COU07_02255 [Candidatus Harrisonbacteria bacterium CG10_big_fil_rev_8_21_14_0_10_40_38]|uniref:NlpC/P60 domain-containing protein n=1 Tax=Candidatus Harrisonbacteria bacterium CG10_big_fil_rev_8_21_14_0_10_40_38 TaxID=1974583 RepID=A0A2H0US94_9BACT|nr:MAG: hypothetical protein COU07_02255 [Candidatus Harrisonbacteria bacterium CG10_big_fil_rev_8_21_14_0_10_40_38]
MGPKYLAHILPHPAKHWQQNDKIKTMKNKKLVVEIIPLKTHLALIKNAVGAKLFRNIYARVNGKQKDILENGFLSCAFFVSSILKIEDLIEKTHATVDGTVKDLEKFGWKEIKKPKIGSVLVWEKSDFGGGKPTKHIGFFVGKNQAISNSSKMGYPKKHHYTYNGKREIEKILHYENLK